MWRGSTRKSSLLSPSEFQTLLPCELGSCRKHVCISQWKNSLNYKLSSVPFYHSFLFLSEFPTYFFKRRPFGSTEALHHFKQCKRLPKIEKEKKVFQHWQPCYRWLDTLKWVLLFRALALRSAGRSSPWVLVLLLWLFSVWNADGKCYFVFVFSSSVVLILSEWYGKQYVTWSGCFVYRPFGHHTYISRTYYMMTREPERHIFQLNFSFQFNNSEKRKTKLIGLAVWWYSQCDSWFWISCYSFSFCLIFFSFFAVRKAFRRRLN